MKKTRQFISLITILPILFFTSNYAWLAKSLIQLFIISMSSFNFLYLGLINENELIETWKIIQKSWNIFLSERQGNDENFAKEFSKSMHRIKDFINLTKKDGSGSYPEDFHYSGYKKDDNTITHSKAPGDWGINESHDFGDYSDPLKKKESAAQAAAWLEYDNRVNEKRSVDLTSDDPAFNSSGTKWFKDYCKAYDLFDGNMPNDYKLRKHLRDIAAGRK